MASAHSGYRHVTHRAHPTLGLQAAHHAASRYALYNWVRVGDADGYSIKNCDRHSKSAAACEVIFYNVDAMPHAFVDLFLNIGRHWDRSITVSTLFDTVRMR